MKLQATATTAFLPAALAAASISLALLLLPTAAAPAHSSGVAPMLKLVGGEVVAAVQAPVLAVARTHHHPRHAVVSAASPRPTTRVQPRSVAAPERAIPAHHRRAVHRRALRPHAATREPATTSTASTTPPSLAGEHGHGKAKARGHLKKLTPKAAPAMTGAAPRVRVDGHGKARGHSADAPPGPPAVPPGQANKASSVDKHGPARGHGGGT